MQTEQQHAPYKLSIEFEANIHTPNSLIDSIITDLYGIIGSMIIMWVCLSLLNWKNEIPSL